jgi:hypothetical protein
VARGNERGKECDSRQNESVRFAPLMVLVGLLLSACSPPPAGSPSAGTVGHFNPGQPYATPSATPYATPNAAEIKRGEDLENREGREAEQNATHANDPANQVKAEQDKIENQIQQEQQKAEGNN